MNVKINYVSDPDNKDEKFMMGAKLDCNISELLIISAALHDMNKNQARNAFDRAGALKMKQSIANAITEK